MKILGLITARGGSKGLEGKNVRMVAGKPLVEWSILAARSCKGVEKTVVSTDSEQIAAISRQAGARVPFLRPAELATDQSPHILAVLHALEWLETNETYTPDYVLLLQPTSPLRTAEDIDASIELAQRVGADAVVSVCVAERHPFKMFQVRDDGTLEPFIESRIAYKRRQDLPVAYAENGAIYLNKVESLKKTRSFIPSGAIPYVMPAERSLDIDTAWDLHLAEFILRERLAKGHQ